MTAPCCKVLRTLGYLFTRQCLCMNACQPLKSRGVTGLVSRSARALGSAVLLGAATGAAMAGAMTLAGATLGKLEVDAEGFPLAVGELSQFATRAEGWLAIAECLLAALPHVRVGPAEADDAKCLWVFGGVGAKGLAGRSSRPPVWVVGRR
jgi:hypothetical protein